MAIKITVVIPSNGIQQLVYKNSHFHPDLKKSLKIQ